MERVKAAGAGWAYSFTFPKYAVPTNSTPHSQP
jgi:hypothetical protein